MSFVGKKGKKKSFRLRSIPRFTAYPGPKYLLAFAAPDASKQVVMEAKRLLTKVPSTSLPPNRYAYCETFTAAARKRSVGMSWFARNSSCVATAVGETKGGGQKIKGRRPGRSDSIDIYVHSHILYFVYIYIVQFLGWSFVFTYFYTIVVFLYTS